MIKRVKTLRAEAYVRHEAGVFQRVRVPHGQSPTNSPLSDVTSKEVTN